MSVRIDVDVVVAGAGLAGLTAAGRLTQLGYRVLLQESGADEQYGCNSRIASGSFSVAQSDPTSDPSALRDAIIKNAGEAADPAQATAIAQAVGPAMQWFREEGAKFLKIGRPGKATSTWSLAPPRPAKPGFGFQGRGPDVALRSLVNRFRQRGGILSLGTRAQALILEGGACVGLRSARGEDALDVRARATVLADGGFQANSDLVRRFISPHPERLVQRNARSGRGDALLMAEAAGAKLVGLDAFYGHLLAQDALTNDLLWPYPTLDTLASGSMVIERSGRRFLDEGIGGVAMANRIAQLDDPLCAIAVFDDAIWERLGRADFTPPNPYVVSSGGGLASAPSLALLGQQLELPAGAIEKTASAYNRSARAGDFSALSPPRGVGRAFGLAPSASDQIALAPLEKPPFHAIRLCVGLTYTMGGIAIDGLGRVLNKDDKPISGLYAAGSCTGGVEGGRDAAYLGGLSKALSQGFIVAQSIAAGGG